MSNDQPKPAAGEVSREEFERIRRAATAVTLEACEPVVREPRDAGGQADRCCASWRLQIEPYVNSPYAPVGRQAKKALERIDGAAARIA